MDQSLELIGTLLGKQERCKEVIDYMQTAKQDLNNRTKDIPDNQNLLYSAVLYLFEADTVLKEPTHNFLLLQAINAKMW